MCDKKLKTNIFFKKLKANLFVKKTEIKKTKKIKTFNLKVISQIK